MPSFAVHRSQLLVDCQAGHLSHLRTRFVVPLLPADAFGERVRNLNPEFVVDAGLVVLGTQFAFTIPLAELGPRVEVIEDEEHRIVLAFDTLIGSA